MRFGKSADRALLRAAVVAALSMTAPLAFGAPLFTVNPDSISGTTGYSNFVADQIASSNTSELVTFNGTTITGSTAATSEGWAQIGNFVNSTTATTLYSNQTGLNAGETNNGYSLYLTYTASFSLASISGSTLTYDVTSLDYRLVADPLENTTFTPAAAGSDTSASVSGGATEDVLLASGSVVPGPQSVATVNTAGGVGINTVETVALTLDGQSFFIQPVPFYSIAFDEFNNTGSGINFGTNGSGNVVESINLATGSFNFRTVPDPGTVALMGMGLLGLGATMRRRRKLS